MFRMNVVSSGNLLVPIESADAGEAWGNFLTHGPRATSLARAHASHPRAGCVRHTFPGARSPGRRALDRATPRGPGTHRTVRAWRRVAAWRFPSIPREPPARPQKPVQMLGPERVTLPPARSSVFLHGGQ